jgi:hypothetical protein
MKKNILLFFIAFFFVAFISCKKYPDGSSHYKAAKKIRNGF